MSVWGRDADGRLVVRSPLANLGHAHGPARAGGGHRGALRQHGVRLLQGLQPWVKFIQGNESSTPTAGRRSWPPTWPCSASCSLVGAGLHPRHDADRRGPDQPRRALPAAFAHSIVPIVIGLRRRALPDLPARGRRADADPDERPVQHRLRTGSARRTGRRRTSSATTRPCWPASRCSPWSSGTWSASSPPTTGPSTCCRGGTSSPASSAAGRDGRLHRRRALPAVRRLSRAGARPGAPDCGQPRPRRRRAR